MAKSQSVTFFCPTQKRCTKSTSTNFFIGVKSRRTIFLYKMCSALWQESLYLYGNNTSPATHGLYLYDNNTSTTTHGLYLYGKNTSTATHGLYLYCNNTSPVTNMIWILLQRHSFGDSDLNRDDGTFKYLPLLYFSFFKGVS